MQDSFNKTFDLPVLQGAKERDIQESIMVGMTLDSDKEYEGGGNLDDEDQEIFMKTTMELMKKTIKSIIYYSTATHIQLLMVTHDIKQRMYMCLNILRPYQQSEIITIVYVQVQYIPLLLQQQRSFLV